MKAHLSLLDTEEILKIHEASLTILAKTGVRVRSAKVRDLLYRAGGEIEGEIVKMPAAMVENALRLVEPDLLLGAREPRHILSPYRPPLPILSTGGYSPFTLDWRTGKVRNATSRDLAEFAAIADSYEEVGFFWPIVSPWDVSPILQEVACLDISFRYTGKHVQCSTSSRRIAAWQLALAEAVAGGKKKLRENPVFSCCIAPISPLTIGASEAEAILLLAEHGIPISPFTTPLSGATAPATIGGTLALANAEILAILTLVKAADRKGKMIYSTDSCASDFHTGAIDYHAPEYSLFSYGHCQLADRYGLPSSSAHDCSEELPFDVGSWALARHRIAMNLMSGTDLSIWLGSKESTLTASLIDMVVAIAMVREVRPYLLEQTLRADASFLADLAAGTATVGADPFAGGKTRHEFSGVYREEEIINRGRRIIAGHLDRHRQPFLSDALLAEMDGIIAHARRDLLSNRC